MNHTLPGLATTPAAGRHIERHFGDMLEVDEGFVEEREAGPKACATANYVEGLLLMVDEFDLIAKQLLDCGTRIDTSVADDLAGKILGKRVPLSSCSAIAPILSDYSESA
jgi:hypothetical protein